MIDLPSEIDKLSKAASIQSEMVAYFFKKHNYNKRPLSFINLVGRFNVHCTDNYHFFPVCEQAGSRGISSY